MSIQNEMVNFSLLNKSGNFFSDQGFSGQANFLIKLFSCTLCCFYAESKHRYSVYSQISQVPSESPSIWKCEEVPTLNILFPRFTGIKV